MNETLSIGPLTARYFADHLGERPIIAILRDLPPDETVELCRRAWSIGVTLVEVPLRAGVVTEAFRAARAAADDGKQIGVGTVLTAAQVSQAVGEGADFVVSPGLDLDVVRACDRIGVPVLPGVATATEISGALRMNLLWQKAFPAGTLGPSWISAQLAPFPSVQFVATGGIDATNMGAFLSAGARAVGIGAAFLELAGIAMTGKTDGQQPPI